MALCVCFNLRRSMVHFIGDIPSHIFDNAETNVRVFSRVMTWTITRLPSDNGTAHPSNVYILQVIAPLRFGIKNNETLARCRALEHLGPLSNEQRNVYAFKPDDPDPWTHGGPMDDRDREALEGLVGEVVRVSLRVSAVLRASLQIVPEHEPNMHCVRVYDTTRWVEKTCSVAQVLRTVSKHCAPTGAMVRKELMGPAQTNDLGALCHVLDRRDVRPEDASAVLAHSLLFGSPDAASVEELLCAHADPNARTGGDFSILSTAAAQGRSAIVRMLLLWGATVDDRSPNHAQTPLMLAAARGATECVQWLLQAGADTEAVDWQGRTALDLSAKNTAVEAILSDKAKRARR